MKLSNLTAKLTGITAGMKAKAVTTLVAAAIAGTVLTAATPAAEAQVRFGVAIGGPGYYAPPPPPPRYGGYRPYAYGYGYPAYGYHSYGYYHRPYYDRWHRW